MAASAGTTYATRAPGRTPTPASPAARRGRPRPPDTIDRDEQVYELLRTGGSSTKAALALALQQRENVVYLALSRLREAGKVRRAAGKVAGAQSKVWEIIA